MFAQSAVAVDVDIPVSQYLVSSRSAPPAAAASTSPAPTASRPVAPVAAAVALAATTGPRDLRIGMYGQDVRALQDILHARGQKVVSDGAFGRGTANAVRRVQRSFHLPASGVATAAFQERIGLQSRLAASAPAAAAPTTAGAPLVGATPAGTAGKYLKVFPVQGTGYHYTDDFGASRHQGSHEGNDIIAPRGNPLVAVTDATIDRMTRVETGLGGIWIWLKDASGTTYYYAHMDSIVDGLSPGSKVKAGQVLGAVGNSGDARYGETHLHFEVHPGGGGAISPFADLTAVDPNPTAARKSG